MITFGPAKVFFPSRRIPVSDMLNYTSDYILVFDADLKITMVNDSFLDFMKIKRTEILGQTVKDMIVKVFKDHTEMLVGIKEAIEGKNSTQDIDFRMNNEYYFFKVNIVPTTFEDGRRGGTIVIKNNTDHKIAEKVIRESEENFRNILKKINKK
jgi:PAS domain S-box-containing protein